MRSLKSIRDNVRKRKLREMLGSYRNRVWLLLLLNLVGFLLLGRSAILPGMPDDEWVALDQWVRTAVFAVVRPTETTPVTYVDIDNALYRDTWGMPTVTPRDALASMVSSLSTSGASMVVVDIDLAWGDADTELDEFFASYAGPVPLVFVRHLEETAEGIRDIATPYDRRFAANSEHLKWAHAYFFSDGDGALREWLPWLVVCADDSTEILPAVATLTSELTTGTPSEPPDIDGCAASEELQAHPIIFTEEFGFVATAGNADAAVWLPDPASPARKLAASYLLDGTAIDYATMFNGRVAVLGGSHTAGQDLRLTPMGVLPGAVIQANTIIHAGPQLASVDVATWVERIVVALMFLVLCLLAFPLAATISIIVALVATGGFSSYAVFAQIEMAALLFIQFRVLAWLAEPCWQNLVDLRWRILLPDYLRDSTSE